MTIVADIHNDDPLVDEEQFGPALPIIKYSDIDDAIESANALDVGLGASVWALMKAGPRGRCTDRGRNGVDQQAMAA